MLIQTCKLQTSFKISCFLCDERFVLHLLVEHWKERKQFIKWSLALRTAAHRGREQWNLNTCKDCSEVSWGGVLLGEFTKIFIIWYWRSSTKASGLKHSWSSLSNVCLVIPTALLKKKKKVWGLFLIRFLGRLLLRGCGALRLWLQLWWIAEARSPTWFMSYHKLHLPSRLLPAFQEFKGCSLVMCLILYWLQ